MKTTRNIKIEENLHNKLKIYCAINNIKISSFVENLISKKIEEVSLEEFKDWNVRLHENLISMADKMMKEKSI